MTKGSQQHMARSATESDKGPLRQAEDNRRVAADWAAQIRAVHELEQRLREEQRDHGHAKQRIRDLVHERAGLGTAQYIMLLHVVTSHMMELTVCKPMSS